MDRLTLLHKFLMEIADSITSGPEEWMKFLSASSNLYKYSFEDQLLIFGQRPDATAVADMATWNKRIGCMVKRGSSAIAILDERQRSGFRYVFDISDTEPYRRRSKLPGTVRLWNMETHQESVMTALSTHYGLATSFADQVYQAAYMETERFLGANRSRIAQELAQCRISEEYNPQETQTVFLRLASLSAAFAISQRCGIPLEAEAEDFETVTFFDQQPAIYALGTAVHFAGETVLRQVERTVKAEEKRISTERSNENENNVNTHLQSEGGLSVSQSRRQPERAEIPGQIRLNAGEVSEGTSAATPGRTANERPTERAPGTGGQRGQGNGGISDRADGNQDFSAGSENTAAGVVTADEYAGGSGGGSGSDGAGLRLNEPAQPDSASYAITQEDIDAALRLGPGTTGGKRRIWMFFQQGDQTEIARFLKQEYGIYGRSFTFADGISGFVEFGRGNGMRLRHPYLDKEVNLTWYGMGQRIGRLIGNGSYLTPEEMEQYESNHLGPDEAYVPVAAEVPDTGNTRVGESDSPQQSESEQAPATAAGYLDADLLDALTGEYGLLEQADKWVVSRYFEAGMDNEATAKKLAGSFAGKTAAIHLLTGEIADYFATETGFELDIHDQFNSKVEISWKDAAAIFRTLYQQERAGFLHEQADVAVDDTKAAEEAVYEGYKAEGHRNAQNFRITDDNLGTGGPKAKYQVNINAIKLLKDLETDGMQASAEQQEVLSRYVGWGGLPEVFDPSKENWRAEYAELKQLLTPKEYEAARASTLNAHYTSPVVIKAIYEAVGGMGFTSGHILEPACGVGNFFGMLPGTMSGSQLYGVELDSISGRIAKQLYPQAAITVAGFETFSKPGFFDLIVGNVPFGQYAVNDRVYNHLGFNIHDYFIAKSIDQVRPGGVVVLLTSRYTMDKQSTEVRRYISQRAELLGAIRLPNSAFRANAGTDVVSDILFLQRRERPIEIEQNWVHLGQTPDGLTINSYYVEHPEMVLGQLTTRNTQYGKEECTVIPIESADLGEQLRVAIMSLPKGNYLPKEEQPLLQEDAAQEEVLADSDVPNYSFTVVNDQIYFKVGLGDSMILHTGSDSDTQRIKGMIGIRDCARELIQCQLDGGSDAEVQRIQAELNQRYDKFIVKWGYLNDRKNKAVFSDDSSVYLLCSMEDVDASGKVVGKSDFFTKRTIRHTEKVSHCDTPREALAVSLNESGRVDLSRIAALTGMTEENCVSALNGVIYRVPGTERYVTAEEYLSGNVRQKLEVAQKAAANDPAFAGHAAALERVQPEKLTADEIDVRIGSTWIGSKYIKKFMVEQLNLSYWQERAFKVIYVPQTGEWKIEGKGQIRNLVASEETYGTPRMPAADIIERTLNLRDVQVFDVIRENGTERRVVNVPETVAARAKQELLQTEFRDWIFRDPERRAELVGEYNRRFNSYRNRTYDGSHLTFPGMSPEIRLREHQVNAVARALYGGNTLLAHVVGAGKTYEIAAIAMEAKRIGFSHKALIVVPNHLTEQWGTEFLRLYPAANILVATEKDFTPDRRKQFCTRIATGDWDAVIIGHSQFERIPLSTERQKGFLQEQMDDILDAIVQAKDMAGERWTIKALERSRKSFMNRLEKLQNEEKKDQGVIPFEALGVDRIFVDEAQAYKNLYLYTKMQNVAGISQSESQRSFDLYQKCRYLDRITGHRGIVFATGTPISNSMVEMYTMQRYLQYHRLEEAGLTHFDAWASTFGETVTSAELAPEGTGYRSRTRFAKFHNLPELMAMFQEVADIKTADELQLDVPNAHYETIVAQRSEIQARMVEELSKRAESVHNHLVSPEEDNMLRITTDGRKIGLDQRLIDPSLPDEPGSKINLAVQNILHIWKDCSETRGTQLVFCDFSTPANPRRFNVYSDMKAKLIAAGVPEQEIAFIHNANTKTQKKALFQKVRAGEVRILFGSTEKMGAGTNIQTRLVAIHDCDCPWRPGDLEQRAGRIVRQGNQNKDVYIYRYVTDATFDAYLYQTVENKQKFISQVMTSKAPVRTCEDVDESVMNYAEIKALCAGSPLIKEKMELDMRVAQLKMLKASHNKQRYRLEDMLYRHLPNTVNDLEQRIDRYTKDIETLKKSMASEKKDAFPPFIIAGQLVDNRGKAIEQLAALLPTLLDTTPVPFATFRGFQIEVVRTGFLESCNFKAILYGAGQYTVELGDSSIGNITRLINAVEYIPSLLSRTQKDLASAQQQIIDVKAELEKPWPLEAEFRAKMERLAELEVLLTLDANQTPDSVQIESPTGQPKEGEQETNSFVSCITSAQSKADIVNKRRQHQSPVLMQGKTL